MMSHDGQDVNLSNSAGRNDQPVRPSSTHVNRPNSSLDQEGIATEQIPELRKRRGGQEFFFDG